MLNSEEITAINQSYRMVNGSIMIRCDKGPDGWCNAQRWLELMTKEEVSNIHEHCYKTNTADPTKDKQQ